MVVAVNNLWPELFVLAPAVAGLSAGWALRRRLVGRRAGIAVATSVVVAGVGLAAGAALLRVARVGVWDAAAMLAAAGLGYVLGCRTDRRELDWQGVALAATATIAVLVLGEVAARVLLPPIPMYYSSDATRIRFPTFDLQRASFTPLTPFDINPDLPACAALYADDVELRQPFGVSRAATDRVVLHVGDSMTQGVGVGQGEAFPAVLQRETPAVRQVNLGVEGTAPDYHLLMVRKAVPRLPVQLVVVHLFIGNDIEGLGQPYRCCADGPLLQLTPDRVAARCPAPRWIEGFGESMAWFAAVSPPPAIVRHYAPVSQLARYVIAAVKGLQQHYFAVSVSGESWWADLLESRERSGRAPSERADEQWKLFEAIMRTLRDELAQEHVPLVASVLPLSIALERPAPKATESYQVRGRMLDILERLHIEALDPWDDIEASVKQHGRDSIFAGGDVHFNASGHRFYAQWLLRHLGEGLGARGGQGRASSTSGSCRSASAGDGTSRARSYRAAVSNGCCTATGRGRPDTEPSRTSHVGSAARSSASASSQRRTKRARSTARQRKASSTVA